MAALTYLHLKGEEYEVWRRISEAGTLQMTATSPKVGVQPQSRVFLALVQSSFHFPETSLIPWS